jgi:hypothetical protein
MKRNKIKKIQKNKSNEVPLVSLNKINNNNDKVNNNKTINNNKNIYNKINNKASLSTNSMIPNNKKIAKVHSLSTDNFTLKDMNDLSLYITNIPSLNDIKKTIDDYYTKNGLYKQKVPTPFVSNLNIISVRIDFPNEKILNGYKSYISFLKYENPQYKQIVIKKTNLFRTIKKIKLNNVKTINNSNNDIDNLLLNEKKEEKLIVRNILKLYRHNKIKLKLDNDKFTYNTLGLRKSGDEKLIVNFYKNQEYLRNSSPYLSEEDKRIINERERRKKFLTPKGFCCSVGKYSCPPKFIPNYVQMSPSENPSTYRFRPVNKKKWITQKGFINA